MSDCEAITRTVSLIGVPLELGASRRGARLGPHVIRNTGILARLQALGLDVADVGDLDLPTAGDDVAGGPDHPKNVAAIVSACRTIADAVEREMRRGAYPVIMGGDHSMAVGVLAGIARVNGPQGVIWIDAHADLNTVATSPSGNLHGMPMAAAFGRLPEIFPPAEFPTPSANVARSVFVALRDVDEGERQLIREHDVACFTMTDIDRLGMDKVMERAVEVAGDGPGSVHVSFDVDSLDPALAPGTGTPVPGGITYREAHLAMELIAQSGVAHSVEISEINPLLDEHDMTAKLAAELICSALGKRIL